jgi:peptidoglycan/LPS O-acetylase OafA/YrhL
MRRTPADQDLSAQEAPARPRRTSGVARFVVVNVLAAAFGTAIWVYGPGLTGHRNLFETPLYPLGLFCGGLCFSALLPRHGWWSVTVAVSAGHILGYVGVCIGDVHAYLWPIGVTFVAGDSLYALAGALVPPVYRVLRVPRPGDSRQRP